MVISDERIKLIATVGNFCKNERVVVDFTITLTRAGQIMADIELD
jgi:hypothetical protein